MSAYYDRLCDMGHNGFWWGDDYIPCNCTSCNDVREGGLEPPSLSAPDPKSDPLTGNRLASECGNGPQRAPAGSSDTQTTTDSTTRGIFSGAMRAVGR